MKNIFLSFIRRLQRLRIASFVRPTVQKTFRKTAANPHIWYASKSSFLAVFLDNGSNDDVRINIFVHWFVFCPSNRHFSTTLYCTCFPSTCPPTYSICCSTKRQALLLKHTDPFSTSKKSRFCNLTRRISARFFWLNYILVLWHTVGVEMSLYKVHNVYQKWKILHQYFCFLMVLGWVFSFKH